MRPIIREIDLATLSDSEALPLHQFLRDKTLEETSEESKMTFEARVTAWRNPSALHCWKRFIVTQDDKILGYTSTIWNKNDTENPHMVWCQSFRVAPEYRCKGIGKTLLNVLLEALQLKGKTTLSLITDESIPAGSEFIMKLCGKFVLHHSLNQLLIKELDYEYLRKSLENPPSDLFEIGCYEGGYPETELEELCLLMDVMNTKPRSSTINDSKHIPEELLEENRLEKRNGAESWFMYVKERSTGRYAGYTKTRFNPLRPNEVVQLGTGVSPEYRGYRLGAWLKATMIDRILKERPTVDRLYTGNADSNIPMLKINKALGFKPLNASTEWELNIAETLRKLEADRKHHFVCQIE